MVDSSIWSLSTTKVTDFKIGKSNRFSFLNNSLQITAYLDVWASFYKQLFETFILKVIKSWGFMTLHAILQHAAHHHCLQYLVRPGWCECLPGPESTDMAPSLHWWQRRPWEGPEDRRQWSHAPTRGLSWSLQWSLGTSLSCSTHYTVMQTVEIQMKWYDRYQA